jgi:hypothetical protein
VSSDDGGCDSGGLKEILSEILAIRAPKKASTRLGDVTEEAHSERLCPIWIFILQTPELQPCNPHMHQFRIYVFFLMYKI